MKTEKFSDELGIITTRNVKEKNYWLNKLSGKLVKSYFPHDYNRKVERQCGFEPEEFIIPRGLLSRLIELSGGSDVRLFITVTAGLVILLTKYTHNKEIIVGTSIYRQKRETTFINTVLPLRNRVKDDMSFKELLMQVGQCVLGANQHQNYPMEILLKQLDLPFSDTGDFPLFDIAILSDNLHDKEFLRHISLNFLLVIKRRDKDLGLDVEYNASLYKKATITRIISHLFNLLKSAIFNVNLLTADIDILSEAEKREILFDFNDTRTDYSRDKTVHLLFEEQVEKTPDNIAVIGSRPATHPQTGLSPGREYISYKELNRKCNQLARELRNKGVEPNHFLGIIIDRSLEMVIGVMAVLKTGGAYVPLEPYLPETRIITCLSLLAVKCLLTDHLQRPRMEKISSQLTGLENIICLDGAEEKGTPVENLPPAACSTDIAYVIFTSGTTGAPKGVIEKHRPVINILQWVNHTFAVTCWDRLLFVTSLSFDLSVYDIFGILAAGGSIRVVKRDEMYSDYLLELIFSEGITFWDSAPAALQQLIPHIMELKETRQYKTNALRLVFLSGDWIPVTMPDILKAVFAGVYVIGLGGATEATIWSNYYPIDTVDPDWNSIPYGKPIQNAKYYILDGDFKPCPLGVPGDLFIGGECLASGYINEKELTAGKFIDNPFVTGEKVYRTGDLARWFPDGNIEFLGRQDNQVKIRGYRIELGEIESRLSRHAGIKAAVVTVKGTGRDTGDKYLCGYYVAVKMFAPHELGDYLSGALPEYMIPAYFVKLDKIPVTPNGKVDRKALPEPNILGTVREYNAPRDEIDKKIVEIWSGILRVSREQISIDANFFELGGHSLSATVLSTKMQKDLNVKLPMVEIFRAPTVRDMAEFVKTSVKEKLVSIQPVEKKEYYPQSSAQKRLFFLDQFENISTAYNMPGIFNLNSQLQPKRIETAFSKLIQRHETLRTSFLFIDDEPVQRVHDHVDFEIEEFPIEKDESKDKNIQRIMKHFNRPFDLAKMPLLRFGYASITEREHLLLFDMHHIISDGTSINILIHNFTLLYNGEEITPLDIQYKDFSNWQNNLLAGGYFQVQQEFWLREFSGDIPVLNLPADFPRPRVQSYEGRLFNFQVGSEETSALRAFMREEEGTLFMVLLAVFNILLYKLSGQEDIIVGVPIAGRNSPSLQSIIGMFANTLALRNLPSGEKSFQEFFREVKQKSIKVFDNQDIQFEYIVEIVDVKRDTGRNPLFDTKFVVQNIVKSGGEAPGLGITPYAYDNPTSKFDLSLDVFEAREHLFLVFEYCTRLFKHETIERFVNYFKMILSFVMNNPGALISGIEILTGEEKNRVLYDFNNTGAAFPGEKHIHDFLEEQAQKKPGKAALVFENEWITYHELDARANQLANYLLAEKGIQPDDRVGILMERSSHLITAIQGVLKAGAAYVPINTALPKEGIKHIIDDAGIEAVISQKKLIKSLNRLQWDCKSLRMFLCMDSTDIYAEEEVEQNELMDKKLWEYVGDTADDDITGGGWKSSYTGQPFTREEMDEYGDNILQKLTPLLRKDMRVLEIGCASGITMFRVAPAVGFYYGTDLSPVIINKNNQRIKQENHQNISLACIPAHEIDTIEEKNFDIVIINSVVHCFNGHNYLRQVIGKVFNLLNDRGYLFIGDVMDQDRKKDLVREMATFKRLNRGKDYITKTDWSAELFVSPAFFEDLSRQFPQLRKVEFSNKLCTIENELTKFRYDMLLTVDKSVGGIVVNNNKHKYQHDSSTLSMYDTGKVISSVKPTHIAYIIYTSGSTGMPKGVMIQHRPVINRLNWMQRFYPINETDVILQKTPIFFDVSVWELFWWSFTGASLHLLNPGGEKDPLAIIEAIEKSKVTVMHFVPSMLNVFLEYIKDPLHQDKLVSLRRVFSSGEALKAEQVERFYRYLPGKNKQEIKLINLYGPTEATVDVSYFDCSPGVESNVIPIGKPIHNIGLFICNDCLKLEPIGMVGELCIGGVGLARGYLNRVELTAVKFINNHFIPGDRLYRTGDRCRWLANGDIEFLGRMDQQVKIRGLRIEPGEIENHLLDHDDINEAVVTAKKDEDGDCYLCAYIVPVQKDKDMETGNLREHLLAKLPDYMVPAFFVQMDKIPLLPNGKINIKALPKHQITGADDYTAPVNEIEKKLTEIWSEILAIAQTDISVRANFFELGGHSLKATILVSKIHKELNVRLPLAEIFRSPAVRLQAESIKGLTEDKFIAVEAVEKKEYYPLSSGQRRLYILQQINPHWTNYNLVMRITWGPAFNQKKFEGIFKKLISRHESLRTSFELLDEKPGQRIKKEVDFSLEYEKGDSPVEIENLVQSFVRPFDLSQSPLMRVRVIKTGQNGHLLLVDIHHIISDPISLENLWNEFVALYQEKELSPLKLQYKDYSEWQHRSREGGGLQKQEDYWLKEFAGEIPLLKLPYDFVPADTGSQEGGMINFKIPAKETRRLRQLAASEGATMFMVLMAAFNILLAKLSGQEDIIVGTPTAGRQHEDFRSLVGIFINTLALRNYPGNQSTFTHFLADLKDRVLEAFENQDYPFEDLLEKLDLKRDDGRNALFNVFFGSHGAGEREALDTGGETGDTGSDTENTGETGEVSSEVPLASLPFDIGGGYVIGNTIDIHLDYSSALFKPATIDKIKTYYLDIIRQVIGNKDIKLKDIKMAHDFVNVEATILQEEKSDFVF